MVFLFLDRFLQQRKKPFRKIHKFEKTFLKEETVFVGVCYLLTNTKCELIVLFLNEFG